MEFKMSTAMGQIGAVSELSFVQQANYDISRDPESVIINFWVGVALQNNNSRIEVWIVQ